MAKTDSFFIRCTKDVGNTNTFHEKEIDLGAFVDALGKSVLRILNIAVIFSDSTGRSTLIDDGESAATQWQLTTQTQTDIVLASDKSVIASGRVAVGAQSTYSAVGGGQHLPGIVSGDFDVSPQHWSNGYLIGVDTIYLGGAASLEWVGDQYVTVILECQSETLSQSAAMALALSQQ
jgi:hypothetical protein